MTADPIKVVAYAGYRGDEAPRRFLEHDNMFEVASVERAWVEEALQSRDRRRCFTVKDQHGTMHHLSCIESTGQWYALRDGVRPTP